MATASPPRCVRNEARGGARTAGPHHGGGGRGDAGGKYKDLVHNGRLREGGRVGGSAETSGRRRSTAEAAATAAAAHRQLRLHSQPDVLLLTDRDVNGARPYD